MPLFPSRQNFKDSGLWLLFYSILVNWKGNLFFRTLAFCYSIFYTADVEDKSLKVLQRNDLSRSSKLLMHYSSLTDFVSDSQGDKVILDPGITRIFLRMGKGGGGCVSFETADVHDSVSLKSRLKTTNVKYRILLLMPFIKSLSSGIKSRHTLRPSLNLFYFTLFSFFSAHVLGDYFQVEENLTY